MPAEPATQPLTAADVDALGRRTKDEYVAALPGIVAEYIGLVRSSGDPETLRKAAELGFRVHGGIIEEKKAASNLPLVNIIIDTSRGTVQMTQVEQQTNPQDIIELEEAFNLLDAQRQSATSAYATEFLNLLPLGTVGEPQ